MKLQNLTEVKNTSLNSLSINHMRGIKGGGLLITEQSGHYYYDTRTGGGDIKKGNEL
jgi:hypothetical protein